MPHIFAGLFCTYHDCFVVTSTLLATNHSTVVCKGGKGGEEVVVNHYAVVGASKDEIDEGKPLNVYICESFFLTLWGIAMLTYDTNKDELSMCKLRWRTCHE